MSGILGEKPARPARGRLTGHPEPPRRQSAPARRPPDGGSVAPPRLAAEERLGDRDRQILGDIVHTYVTDGEPVGSRTVSKHVQHGLPPPASAT